MIVTRKVPKMAGKMPPFGHALPRGFRQELPGDRAAAFLADVVEEEEQHGQDEEHGRPQGQEARRPGRSSSVSPVSLFALLVFMEDDVGDEVDDEGHDEEDEADGEERVIVGRVIRDLAELDGDIGGHGPHRGRGSRGGKNGRCRWP